MLKATEEEIEEVREYFEWQAPDLELDLRFPEFRLHSNMQDSAWNTEPPRLFTAHGTHTEPRKYLINITYLSINVRFY